MDGLESERLLFREPTLADAADVADYMDDEHIAAYIPGVPYPYALTDAKDWIRMVQGHDPEQKREWVLAHEGRVIGAINVHDLDFENHRCKIGYVLSREYHRQGLMTEAVTRLLDYVFDDLGMLRVEADIFSGNQASRGLVEKIGFVHEGVLRSYVNLRGERLDCHVYGLLREEWS